jgi:hypothetical protein
MTFGPKQVKKIGCWNVRLLWLTGCLNQVVQEMKNYNLEILGLNGTRWALFGEHQTQDGELLLFLYRFINHYYIQGEKMNSIRKG